MTWSEVSVKLHMESLGHLVRNVREEPDGCVRFWSKSWSLNIEGIAHPDDIIGKYKVVKAW
jgi:hypothetical protein